MALLFLRKMDSTLVTCPPASGWSGHHSVVSRETGPWAAQGGATWESALPRVQVGLVAVSCGRMKGP